MEKQTYTVEEVAEIFGISKNLAYTAVQRGEIPSQKFGRRIVVPKPLLDRMLQEGWQPGAQGQEAR